MAKAPAPISRFDIHGLFGQYNVSIPIRPGPLVIVGPNGSGKSTVLSILNETLSAQWDNITRYAFDAISFSSGDDEFYISREDILLLQYVSTGFKNTLHIRRPDQPWPERWEEARNIIRISRSGILEAPAVLNSRYEFLRKVQNFILRTTKSSILYYPTYRRIEREIGEMLDLKDAAAIQASLSAGIRRRFDQNGEVIGFGGQDIYGLINLATSEIENHARQALNEHSVKFLEFLYQPGRFTSLGYRDTIMDSNRIDRLIEQIETLSPNTIKTAPLRASISSIAAKIRGGGSGRLSAKEEVTIIYMAQLLQAFRQIETLIRPLQQFCRIVTTYLEPHKTVILDETHFQINIVSHDQPVENLESFSSGEKQIISLFAFLMFAPPPRGKILLIDEPELSLSVIWQKRLIQDLLSTERPEIFITATHSPFVFEGMSLDHTLSVDELLVRQ